MMIRCALLTLLGSAAQANETVPMVALPAEQIVAEFDRICVSGFPKPPAQARIAQSRWAFVKRQVKLPIKQEWQSKHGILSVAPLPPGHEMPALPQCTLDAASRTALSRDQLSTIVERQLMRFKTVRQPKYWSWPIDAKNEARLYIVGLSSANARQVSLSLQRWPKG